MSAYVHEFTRPDGHTIGFHVICEPCGYVQAVETPAHAVNAEALHNRTAHGDDAGVIAVDLSRMAWAVIDAREPITTGGDAYDRGYTNGALIVWQALTGVEDDAQALALARSIAAADPAITAHVAPF